MMMQTFSSFWLATNMAEAAPIIGAKLKLLLLGGHTINGGALLRFYVLHCVGIPLVAAFLMAVHFWRVRKDGGISGPV